jgi:hypothetical protein
MRKLVLTIALVVTASNVAIGIAYAAVCQGSGGARACGEKCVVVSDGGCGCFGSCTADELNWVDGANKGGDEEELLAE